jgi:hypothetical protein
MVVMKVIKSTCIALICSGGQCRSWRSASHVADAYTIRYFVATRVCCAKIALCAVLQEH